MLIPYIPYHNFNITQDIARLGQEKKLVVSRRQREMYLELSFNSVICIQLATADGVNHITGKM